MTLSTSLRRHTLVLGLCAALPLSSAVPASAEAPAAVTIRVDAAHPGRTIPEDFLGLSFEADLMHRPWIDPAAGNVDELLGNLGAGNIRFSANQVDRTAWTPDPSAPVPDWAGGQRVTPEDLSRVGALARSTGWSVDLGLNLGHYDPEAAADEAREARRRIGGSLRSVQVGNEPNFYALAPLLKAGKRRPYLPKTYIRDVKEYRAAIRAAAPGVAIEGPDTAGAAIGNKIADPVLSALLMAPWLEPYAAAFGSESRYLNHHYYPFVNIGRVGIPDALVDLLGGPPTIDKLMSRENARKQTAYIREFTALARRAGLEPKLSETNAVAKEGREGVTNSFGAALWTVDHLLTAAREGVTGVNLHNQPADCESYSLVCFADDAAQRSGRARPNPNYYAALLVARLGGGRILPVTVESGPAHVSAYAVRMPGGGVEVVVNNLDRAFAGDVDVRITGAASGPASAVRLTAASPEATDGAEFAGAQVAEDGTFAPGRGEDVPGANGRYGIRVDGPSAVLLTVG